MKVGKSRRSAKRFHMTISPNDSIYLNSLLDTNHEMTLVRPLEKWDYIVGSGSRYSKCVHIIQSAKCESIPGYRSVLNALQALSLPSSTIS